ncbi:uncharacterized protein CBO05P1_305 [Clostridium botulinum B str. Osaka05]|uniref:Uncharacterized protein n=1 Tax=Clostridium botulinum B str. Osaka05 TaxID=1407017 RepID=A0A060N9P8_CLOBO|nr:hypothetical protein [Clostridium botulinum]BAO05024.1 uncharacterized protein CBO05P1_305 [Clostridium botulinum B str. Osaka05]
MKENKKELLDVIIDFRISSGYEPSIQELEECGYNELMFIDKFGGYSKALLLADARYKLNPIKKTRKELLQIYLDFCKEKGKLASEKDLNQSHNVYDACVFKDKFNGMGNLKKIAKEALIEYRKYTQIRFNEKKYSKLQLENILLKEYIKHGRILTNKEINTIKQIPDTSTFKVYFKVKSMKEVWEEVLKDVCD